MMTLQIKNDTVLVSAVCRKSGNAIVVEDDGMGELWAWGDNPYASSPSHIVRASSVEQALEMVYDLLKPIDEDEVHEAYGFDSRDAFLAAAEPGAELNLVEGYHYQANMTGTGIVSVDHYERIWPLSAQSAREQVKLSVRHWDDVDLSDLD